MNKELTRREFFRIAALTSFSLVASACAPAFAPPPALFTPAPGLKQGDPHWTPIPSSTPIVRGEQISQEEFETFGGTLSTIFERAYNTNPKVAAHKRDPSISQNWEDAAVTGVMQQSFNDQFQKVLNTGASSLNRGIKARADQYRVNSKKGIYLYSNWGSPYPTADYIYTLKAIRDLYFEKGYAVEYMPTINPPWMTIYRPQSVKRTQGQMSALGVPIFGEVTAYVIDNRDSKAILFDSFPLLGLTSHPGDQVYSLDKPEYFIHRKEIDELTLKLVNLDSITDPQEKPVGQYGIEIRNTAKRIMEKINNEKINVAELNLQIIELHTRMHAVEPHMPMTPNEMRSYIGQTGSDARGGPRLSLATLLYAVSQDRYSTQNGPIIFPGVGETLDLFIDRITNDFKQDQTMRNKLSLDSDSAPKAEYIPNNGQSGNFILPGRQYSAEYVEYVLSRLDNLDDADIRNVVRKMFESQKHNQWFPPGLGPTVGMGQDRFNQSI